MRIKQIVSLENVITHMCNIRTRDIKFNTPSGSVHGNEYTKDLSL